MGGGLRCLPILLASGAPLGRTVSTRDGEPDYRPVIISRGVETCRDCGLSVLNGPPMLNVIGAKKTAVPVHASTWLQTAVHFAPGKVKGLPLRRSATPIHANFIAFLAQEAKLKKSLTHLSLVA